MENLHQITKLWLCACFALCISTMGLAQDDHLFVHHYDGSPYLKYKDSTEAITIGTKIDHNAKLVMHRDDTAYLLNKEGELIELHETGTFKYKDIVKLKPIQVKKTTYQKMMLYFWKEFTNNFDKNYTKSGFVYRGDYVKLLNPMDSLQVYANELKFEWEAKPDKTQPYYFILKEANSDKVIKIGTNDTSIILFIDGINLQRDKSYEWTVAESKFVNLETTNFSSFKILNKEEHAIKKAEAEELSGFLRSIGHDESEIKTMICRYYKLCF
ncbi:MAG: hypothetical protein HKN40_05160 [Winogradskyella sp.]|uniref:hypothetical protein n=1 Tax=Winogradskyella sp. TaxID=1883156 RepID=UPI0017E5F4CC|nr:hypothetical protein [Winogradskyella sp.]